MVTLARLTFRVIGQNLVWAFGYNVVMIPLAVAGILTPAWAARAMAASRLSVVSNALRLRRFRAQRNTQSGPRVVTQRIVVETDRENIQSETRSTMTSMGTSTNVIEVTDQTFEQVVVEGSKERPVVVDMWAEWCGPCRQLTPTLEKVADERDGAFLLAKLDTDANPMTASSFGVQSIPTVIAFKDGQVVTGFIGAYPEPEVNKFIDSILPTEADKGAEEARSVEEAGDLETAEERYRQVLEDDPDNREAAVGLARILLERNELDEAEGLLGKHRPDPEAERILAAITLRRWADAQEDGTLGQAKRLVASGDVIGGLAGLLQALVEDRDPARDAMITVFTAVGDEDPLVQEYRRLLSAALF
jgi:putative thioredoxin